MHIKLHKCLHSPLTNYIALHQYNVLLLVQVKQDKDSLRQTGNNFKTDIPTIMLMVT